MKKALIIDSNIKSVRYPIKTTTKKYSYMLERDERIIVETTAQMKVSKKKLSGKLILTSKRIFFLKENLQEEITIPLQIIGGMKEYKIWGLFSKGILINYLNNSLLIFVEYPKDWLKLINRQIGELVN